MSVYNDMASDAGYRYGTQENQQMAEMLEQEEMYAYYLDLEYNHYREQEYILYQQELYEYDMMIVFMQKECREMWE